MRNVFLIVDGNSIACRGAFAPPVLVNSKGRETSGTFRFISMLDNAMKMVRATHVVVAFDVAKDNFRTQIDPSYKANREVRTTDSLYSQFEDIKKFLDAVGIKHVGIYGYEADDVVGTYTSNSNADRNYIFSGDKDSFQLINENTSVLFPITGTSNIKTVDVKTFEEDFSIRVDQFVDMKALMGDAGDNVKGIEKCGQKTAAKWLQQYNDLDTIVNNAHEIKGKIGENLRAWVPDANKTRELVRICRTVPVPYDYKECEIDLKWENTVEIFSELEFNSYLTKVKRGGFYSVYQ